MKSCIDIYKTIVNIQEENQRMKEELIELKNNKTIINNIQINNNNNINILIKNFYADDLMSSIVNTNFIKKIESSLENGSPNILDVLIKNIHFDKDNESCHNIYSTNIRDKIVHFYEEDAWARGDNSDFNIISYTLMQYVEEFKQHYTDIIRTNPEFKSDIIERNIKNYNNIYKKPNNIESDIINLLFKYKEIPISTRKRNIDLST
jgi:hypothetical protein